ncbi:uncharacterized protein PSFLO_03999 [Pseudozyma flocculosa]|uniref:Uncharacterized protein n=1 Tax=Pseudozyma flocculosa TaxID=84751 RepID=A0A5C3F5J7_9BASI|nr:uncharacterized protein PSFLO_03999 [Pseudozyma flocculosa]
MNVLALALTFFVAVAINPVVAMDIIFMSKDGLRCDIPVADVDNPNLSGIEIVGCPPAHMTRFSPSKVRFHILTRRPGHAGTLAGRELSYQVWLRIASSWFMLTGTEASHSAARASTLDIRNRGNERGQYDACVTSSGLHEPSLPSPHIIFGRCSELGPTDGCVRILALNPPTETIAALVSRVGEWQGRPAIHAQISDPGFPSSHTSTASPSPLHTLLLSSPVAPTMKLLTFAAAFFTTAMIVSAIDFIEPEPVIFSFRSNERKGAKTCIASLLTSDPSALQSVTLPGCDTASTDSPEALCDIGGAALCAECKRLPVSHCV